MYNLDRLELEITRNCPYDCLHCSTSASMDQVEYLTDEQIFQIINDSINFGVKKIVLTGGEPLLKTPDFFNCILSTTTENNQYVDIYTSGWGLSDELLDVFNNYTNFRFCVSVEGTEKTHDDLSQVNGSYFSTLSFIKRITLAKMPLRFHFTVMENNYRDISHVLDLALEYGVRDIKLFKFIPQGRGMINASYLDPSPEHVLYVKNQIKPYLSKMDIDIGGNLFSEEQCCSLGKKITITNDGHVLPCLGLLKFKEHFYNINQFKMQFILEKYNPLINENKCLCELYPQAENVDFNMAK